MKCSKRINCLKIFISAITFTCSRTNRWLFQSHTAILTFSTTKHTERHVIIYFIWFIFANTIKTMHNRRKVNTVGVCVPDRIFGHSSTMDACTTLQIKQIDHNGLYTYRHTFSQLRHKFSIHCRIISDSHRIQSFAIPALINILWEKRWRCHFRAYISVVLLLLFAVIAELYCWACGFLLLLWRALQTN